MTSPPAKSDAPRETAPGPVLVRHEGGAPRERSACGWRDRLISREDAEQSPAAWAHAVDIDGARPHFHKRSIELYYVLAGAGTVTVGGLNIPSKPGPSFIFPPG
jgi:mannose-6-phosphate isomerase-like protein (cupin superfamily)